RAGLGKFDDVDDAEVDLAHRSAVVVDQADDVFRTAVGDLHFLGQFAAEADAVGVRGGDTVLVADVAADANGPVSVQPALRPRGAAGVVKDLAAAAEDDVGNELLERRVGLGRLTRQVE